MGIPNGDHAFIPNPLPPNWRFPERLWPLLAEAKHYLGILEGVGRNLPNPHILLRPLADREAIRSSRLEGTYVTAKELLLFELEPKEPKTGRSPINDQLEVLNYRRALQHGVASELPVSLRLIRDTHSILMRGVRGKDPRPGEFRQSQVAIGTMSRFVPPPSNEVPRSLNELEKYIHADNAGFDPLVNCFLVHYQFEAIHPFVDGNGRVGRLLLALMLQRDCRLSKPWLYMSEYFERNRDEYIDRLYRVSTDDGWAEWTGFCLQGTLQQTKETLQRCERLRAIHAEYKETTAQAGGSVRLIRIVEDIFNSPFIQVSELAKRLGVSYPTAKSDIERLVEAGILQPLPDVSPRTFFAPKVLDVAYEELDGD